MRPTQTHETNQQKLNNKPQNHKQEINNPQATHPPRAYKQAPVHTQHYQSNPIAAQIAPQNNNSEIKLHKPNTQSKPTIIQHSNPHKKFAQVIITHNAQANIHHNKPPTHVNRKTNKSSNRKHNIPRTKTTLKAHLHNKLQLHKVILIKYNTSLWNNITMVYTNIK